ncbi:MAG: ABC transporter substrate-binding protein [Deltaproteobacteria bacterium]|nr:ABC transporter substrate-binding protein [Deltaproteobacteria bacterium]
MRKIIVAAGAHVLAAMLLVLPARASLAQTGEGEGTRVVVGGDGREVRVPLEVKRVAPTIPAFAQVTEMLTLGGGRIVAYPERGIGGYFKKVFPDLAASNPRNFSSRSVEDVIASGAQVVFGPGGQFSDEELAQLGRAGAVFVPAAGLGTAEELGRSFMIIGEILGPREAGRAAEFLDYYRGNMELARGLARGVPESGRVGALILFGGGGGFRTINKNDICHEYLEAAGGRNLAAGHALLAGAGGAPVGAEDIVVWAPEVVVVSSREAYDELTGDPALADVPAVRNGRVHVCPSGVFLWAVRSAEGAMMPLWLGTILYPELFAEVDMEGVVTEFYKNFYARELPAAELRAILAPGSGAGE